MKPATGYRRIAVGVEASPALLKGFLLARSPALAFAAFRFTGHGTARSGSPAFAGSGPVAAPQGNLGRGGRAAVPGGEIVRLARAGIAPRRWRSSATTPPGHSRQA